MGLETSIAAAENGRLLAVELFLGFADLEEIE